MKVSLHRSLLNLGCANEAEFEAYLAKAFSAEFMRTEGLSENEIAKRVESWKRMKIEWTGTRDTDINNERAT